MFAFSSRFSANLNLLCPKVVQQLTQFVVENIAANFILFPAVKEL